MEGFAACFCSMLYLLFALALSAFSIWCMWNIAKRAGFEPVYSLLMLIPLFNFYVLYVFAFQPWPIDTQAHGGGGEPPPV